MNAPTQAPSRLSSIFFRHAIGSLIVTGGALGASSSIAAGPTGKTVQKTTQPNCSSVFVLDNKTGTVLKNENGDELQDTASLIKLITIGGARIALKGEDSGFKSETIYFGAPTDLKPSQIFHYESCKPHIFQPGKKVRDVRLTIPQANNALMTVSANPVSYGLFDRIIGYLKLSSFADLVKTVLSHANIPQDSIETNGEDPSGMGSALRCERKGHKASMRTIAQLLNFTLDMTPEDEINTLLSRTQNIGGLIAPNTNPFLGYKGTKTIGKTGTVIGLSTGVFRVKHQNVDLTFAVSCENNKSRLAIGHYIINEFVFNSKPLPNAALDIPLESRNSQRVTLTVPTPTLNWYE